MEIVRKELNPNEIAPTNRRYNPETDSVEFTPDGGETWNPDPNDDPRHNPGLLLPPRGGDNVRCDAAEAMMQHFKAQVDAFLESASILQLVSTWLALLAFIPGVGILIALFFAIADALFVTGTTVVAASMTDPVYEQIKCLIYCAIDDEGRMTADNVTLLYSRIESDIGGIPSAVFSSVTSAWGEVGFSNAGASGEYTGDCSECGECGWAYEWDVDELSSWDNCFGRGTYSPGVGWIVSVGSGFVATTPNSGNNSDLHANPNHWEADITASGAAGNGYVSVAQINGVCTFTGLDPGYMSLDGVPTYPGYGLENGFHTYTYDDDGAHSFAGVFVNPVINDEDATLIISRVRLSGTGSLPPFVGGHIV